MGINGVWSIIGDSGIRVALSRLCSGRLRPGTQVSAPATGGSDEDEVIDLTGISTAVGSTEVQTTDTHPTSSGIIPLPPQPGWHPVRLAIDASLWIYHSHSAVTHFNATNASPWTPSQGLKNQPNAYHLRVFFFRLCRLLVLGIKPIVVFDGWNKSKAKRGGRGSFGSAANGFIILAKLFGNPVKNADGEAEQECARLELAGEVDLSCTDDADYFLFGGRYLMRTWRAGGWKPSGSGTSTPTKSKSRGVGEASTPTPMATSTKRKAMGGAAARSQKISDDDSDGASTADEVEEEEGSDLTHTRIYRMPDLKKDYDLDRAGLLLIALLCGCDYGNEGGIKGIGPVRALELAKAGYGAELLAEINQRRALPQLRPEQNSPRNFTTTEKIAKALVGKEESYREVLSRKRPSSVKALTESGFPDMRIVDAFYGRDGIQQAGGQARQADTWEWSLPDIEGLRRFCVDEFEWTPTYTEKMFEGNLYPAVRLLQLRLEAHRKLAPPIPAPYKTRPTSHAESEVLVQGIHRKRVKFGGSEYRVTLNYDSLKRTHLQKLNMPSGSHNSAEALSPRVWVEADLVSMAYPTMAAAYEEHAAAKSAKRSSTAKRKKTSQVEVPRGQSTIDSFFPKAKKMMSIANNDV
ncbi:uncharacterized protein EV422DRAFT_502733 [Fimicolochytrium jonesii]|uniref:uncharacterized protein n=1 Tax=Fimicolochytrium jonesii TaxID=1396493 RepID=UPI0022FED05F|nr:uncharacterized protein EV422DRAFT_502733 [Fimicolochytrium jonesii]KAI8827014.1 hypothetical protein EV422DRAFT_502733 [Fimicolochytrium jonesii]